jgi:hypothetical protein
MRFISTLRNRRSLRIGLLLCAALVVIPLEALLLSDILDSRPACVRAEEWVRAHSGSLPTLYDQLASYPMSHRRAIFGNLAPEVRADLWQEQLSRFQAERDLTPDQQEFVEWCKREAVTPDNYRRGGLGEEVLKTTADRIVALFTEYEDRRLFVQLGPAEPRLASFEGARLSLAERLRATFTADSGGAPGGRRGAGLLTGDVHAQAPTYGNCTCNVEAAGQYFWECGWSGQYLCLTVGCTAWNACGLFGLSTCNGCCCYWHHTEYCNC